MFGGLELKGAGSSPERKEKKEEPTSAAAASPFACLASSGFSFLNSSGAGAGAGAAAPAASADPAPAAGATSAFSFLSGAPSAPPSEVTIPKPTAPADVSSPAGGAGSVFDFIATAAPGGRQGEQEVAGQQGAVKAAPSFSFLDVAAPGAPAHEPLSGVGGGIPSSLGGQAAATGGSSSLSVVSGLSRDPSFELPGPSPSPPNPPISALTASTLPVGAGVTFGAGLVAAGGGMGSGGVVKKRNRTARIGAAANAAAASLPPPAEASSQLPPRQPAGASSGTGGSSSRDSALEATRRAEEFLNEKLKEQSQAASFRAVTGSSKSLVSSASSRDGREDEPDEDSVIAAARAAAEEAQQLSHKAASAAAHRSVFGGLFRSRASPPAEGLSYSSGSAHNGGPIGHSSAADAKNPATAVDRLQSQQEEIKRAQAERQFKMMQEHQTNAVQAPPVGKPEEVRRTPSYTVPESTLPSNIPGPPELKKAVSAPARKQRDSQLLSTMNPSVMAAAVSPSTSQPKSPVQAFEEMQRSFREKVVAAMTQVTKLRQHRSGLLQERFLTLAKERLATQSKSHAEAQQTAAAEAEDFETADQMSRIIEAHERERVEISAVLESIQQALKQLEEQKSQVVEGVTKCFVEMEAQLKDFAKNQESNDSHIDAEALKSFAAVSKQLSAESERLQHDLKHLERDSELVEEERKELEAAISEQAGEFERLRDECQATLKGVEGEIEELRKQLQEKQREAARLRTEAAGHDESVLKVRVKFSRQLQRVQKKESTIKDNREEWEQEKKTHECHREDHEAKVRDHSEALLARDKLLETLTKEIEMVATFEEIVAKEIGFGIMTEADVDGELAQLQTDVVKCEAAVTEAKEFLKVATSALAALEEEIEVLEARLPALEQAKTDAATCRDFKGAARASKEIKEATSRLKECKEELLGEAVERHKFADAELKSREQVLEEKRAVAQEQERNQSTAAMRTLSDNIRRLIATKKSICADAKPESVQGVGAYVLDSQIAALQYEGETYGEKYGGWEDLMTEIGPDMPPSPRAAGGTSADECEAVAKEPEASNNTEQDMKADDTEIEDLQREGSDPTSKEDAYRKYRDLVRRLKDTEGAIEAAAADEDYDKAAELDEALAGILADLEGLNLTDEEMEAALLSGQGDGDPPDEPAGSIEEPSTAGPAKDNTQLDESLENEPETAEAEEIDPTEEFADDGEVSSIVGQTSTEDAADGGDPDVANAATTEEEVPPTSSTDRDESDADDAKKANDHENGFATTNGDAEPTPDSGVLGGAVPTLPEDSDL